MVVICDCGQFLAVLISYSGSDYLFQSSSEGASFIRNDDLLDLGISIGAALTGIYLSIRFKTPIITAWSAPGTALLVSLFPNISLNEAVAAYITTAIVILIVGMTGYFDKLLKWIPQGIAAGMMAGILFQFGLGLFHATDSLPLIVFSMLLCYLLARRFSPRYSMLWVLLCGVALSFLLGKMNPVSMDLHLAIPQFIRPEWSWYSTSTWQSL